MFSLQALHECRQYSELWGWKYRDLASKLEIACSERKAIYDAVRRLWFRGIMVFVARLAELQYLILVCWKYSHGFKQMKAKSYDTTHKLRILRFVCL